MHNMVQDVVLLWFNKFHCTENFPCISNSEHEILIYLRSHKGREFLRFKWARRRKCVNCNLDTHRLAWVAEINEKKIHMIHLGKNMRNVLILINFSSSSFFCSLLNFRLRNDFKAWSEKNKNFTFDVFQVRRKLRSLT